MAVNKEEQNRIYEEIKKFQNWAKRYKLKTDINKLCQITGIKRKITELIMNTQSIEYITVDDIEKFRTAEKEIKNFFRIIDINEGFKRIPDKKFSELYDAGKSELRKIYTDLSDTLIAEDAKALLGEKYSITESKALNECINAFYQQNIKTYKSINHILSRMDYFEKTISVLEDEYYLCEHLIYDGVEMSTGEYDEDGEMIEVTVPLSTEEMEKTQKEKERLKKELENLRRKYNAYKATLSEKDLQTISKLKESKKKERNNVYRKFEVLKEHNINKMNIKRFNFDRLHILSSDQQRSVLQILYERFLDDKKYLSPEFLKLGLEYARYNIPDDSRLMICLMLSQKYEPVKAFNGDYKKSAVYEMINSHRNVFFGCNKESEEADYSIAHISDLVSEINELTPKSKDELINYLYNEFYVSEGNSSEDRAYNKMLSEYFDILSEEPPIKGYDKFGYEQIYNIVYQICSESENNYTFSYELVRDILYKIHFNQQEWLCMMYISSYYHKYKETESIRDKIENKKLYYKQFD